MTIVLLILLFPILVSIPGILLTGKLRGMPKYSAPQIGLAIYALSTPLCSLIFKLNLAWSTYFIFFVCLLLMAPRIAKRDWKAEDFVSVVYFSLIFYSIYGLMLISESILGVRNFDFLYNVQDGIYLQTHTFGQYNISPNIFPINWSADPMGRFAASGLISALNRISYTPIRWGGVVFVASISAVILSTLMIVKIWFSNSSRFLLVVGSLLIILNSENLQGWNNTLLGQTSGLSTFLLLIGVTLLCIKSNSTDRTHLFLLAAVAQASLYFSYPALFLFALPVYLYLVITIFKQIEIRQRIYFLLIWLVLFVVLGISGATNHIDRLSSLLNFNSKTSGMPVRVTKLVFNQYSSWLGPLISSGWANYPIQLGLYTVFCLLSLVTLCLIACVVWRDSREYWRLKFPSNLFENPRTFIFIYLISTYVGMFLIVKSNYFLFKVSTWIIPLVLALSLISLWAKLNEAKNRSAIRVVIVSLCLPLAFNSTVNVAKLFNSNSSSFKYATDATSKTIHNILLNNPNPVVLDFPSSEDAAWVAVNSNSLQIKAFTTAVPPRQVLELGFSRNCFTLSEPPINSDLLFPRKTIDIYPVNLLEEKTSLGNKFFALVPLDQVDLFIASNSGQFYPNISTGWPFSKGTPFRWSNGFVCFSIWSKSSRYVDLTFAIQKGPSLQKIAFKKLKQGSIIVEENSFGSSKLTLRGIRIHSGWNYVKVDSLQYPNYITTSSVLPDFRPLAFAIGPIKIFEQAGGSGLSHGR